MDYNYKRKMSFKYEFDKDEFVEMTLSADSDWSTAVEYFEQFLKACGYNFENGYLDMVYPTNIVDDRTIEESNENIVS